MFVLQVKRKENILNPKQYIVSEYAIRVLPKIGTIHCFHILPYLFRARI